MIGALVASMLATNTAHLEARITQMGGDLRGGLFARTTPE
jgi:hypothetical protein